MVRCVECTDFSLRDDADAARSGSGKCRTETLPSVRYVALLDKHCERFDQAGEQIVSARLAWLHKEGITT